MLVHDDTVVENTRTIVNTWRKSNGIVSYLTGSKYAKE